MIRDAQEKGKLIRRGFNDYYVPFVLVIVDAAIGAEVRACGCTATVAPR